jgi:hypothetical protein
MFVEWVKGEIVPEFYLDTPVFSTVIPLPFWKVVALCDIAFIWFLVKDLVV